MGGRRLTDLRVLELRQELEKRGLDKSGIKAVLVERLTAALEKEGVDVDNYLSDAGDSSVSGSVTVKVEEEDVTENVADVPQVTSEEQKDDSEEVSKETEVVAIRSEETSTSEAAVVEEHTVEEPEAEEEKDKHTGDATAEETEEVKIVAEANKAEENVESAKEKVEEDGESSVKEKVEENGESSVKEKVEENIESVKEKLEENIESSAKEKVEATSDSSKEKLEEIDTSEVKDNTSTTSKPKEVQEPEAKTEKEAVVEAGAPEDDHDELHITIGEEEDKFIMDGEDSNVEAKAESGTKKETTAEKDDKKVETDKEGDSTGIHVEATEAGKSDASNNDVMSASNQVKSNDKSVEGRAHRKSREEDRDTLLVTGLSAETAATDLKNIFKKYGKIGGVKIMLSAKDPGASRFALVAVLATEDVETCIQKLDGYELHGRIIHVQKAGTDMLSADWSRKEGNRESGTKRSSSAVSKSAVKSNSEDDKAKRAKRSPEKTPIKSESRRKSASEKSSASKEKDKDKKSASGSEEKKKVESSGSKPPREKERKEGNGRGRGDFNNSRPFRGRRGGFRDLPHHTQGGLRVRPRAPMHGRRDYGQMSGRRDFQRRTAFHNREGRDLVPRSPPRFRRQEAEPPRRGGRAELTFEDIYDIRQREKVREMEREKREMERRRMEEEEKQAQLDMEIRQLAKQREKIEQEKLELKRQKERMILEEREKQKLERERIQREKEELARRLEESRRLVSSSKRNELDYDLSAERKKPVEDRTRHRDSYAEPSYSREKDKLRTEPYRRPEASRYGQLADERPSHLDSPGRGVSVRSAPERDPRSSVWTKDRIKSREERTPERSSHHRERDLVASPRLDDRKSKPYSQVVQLAGSSQQRYPVEAASTHFNIPSSNWTREVEAKAVDNYSANLRDQRWTQRAVPAYSSDSHSSAQLGSVRAESWTARDAATWIPPERSVARPIVDIPERWVSGSGAALNAGGRTSLPVAPPAPIYSAATSSISMSGHGGAGASYLGTRSYDYDYKLSSSGQRR